jgi:hypothetical protein
MCIKWHNPALMKKFKDIIASLLLISLTGFGPFWFFQPTINIPAGSQAWFETEAHRILTQATNLDPKVLKMSLYAYLRAKTKGISKKQLLTIIDYSKPSIERRLWVIDLRNAKVLYNTWVTHGRNSGKMQPTSFSNQLGSLKSSLGVFLTTTNPYMGSNGYSLRLIGLERGINDRAYERDIVFHGASYANPKIIKKYGILGRSWGCPAVSDDMARPLINTIKDKSLVFVYYPDRNWLTHSTFLASSRTDTNETFF